MMLSAILLAQMACIADMLFRGETLRMPIAGGAATQVRRADGAIAFYAVIVVWVVMFAAIDAMIFSRFL